MLKLTDQEKQEILRFVEADKPLPDKYRFLLFGDKREVELVWNGKTGEVCNIVLPFQTIEQVDEPRAEKAEDTKAQPDLFDTRGRQQKGWTNKLIWGDNKLILSSLKNGPMREEIEKQGGIKLIYIDPPFDVGADFSMDIEIGGDTFTKKPNILEEIAYRDTWGKGADSFISMIYERLVLMRDLLADDGSIYVHCDWRVNSYIKNVMDEVFGKERFRNEIIWKRSTAHSDNNAYGNLHDVIYYYSKSQSVTFNTQYDPYSDEYISIYFRHEDSKGKYLDRDLSAKGLQGGGYTYSWKGKAGLWRCPIETMQKYEAEDRIYYTSTGTPRYKQYLQEMPGVPAQDIWTNIFAVNSQAKERIAYPTQKPEAFVERIVSASSNENDIVADFFVGSGTTAAVAEKLGRKWICTDLGKFAIHTTRKRMIGVQRELKAAGKDYRAFEILNLGKYERQHFVGMRNADFGMRNDSEREEISRKIIEQKESEFVELILRAYQAEATDGFNTFQGKKAGRLVAIGPVNLPVSRLFVEEVLGECVQKHITRIDILGFEFEMGLVPSIRRKRKTDKDEKEEVTVIDPAALGIDLSLKYIPAEVFDKRAVEKNQVVFHDVSYIEVRPHIKGRTVAIELTDFSVFYSQDSVANAEQSLKNKASKIVVEAGKIIKVSKDKDGIVTREVLTEKWTDWVDYWSVDFNYESKKETIRKPLISDDKLPGMEADQQALVEYEDVWTGDYIFENEWQSFRTKRDRSIELKSVFHECEPGRRKIAVKVVDIFGNDTMTIVEVSV
ncbi:MAG: site-specific DNA-methyltransferase [Pyrinomonadaceae bacterium]